MCPTCEFTQLGEAIRAAAPGATIRLGPGHYSGPVGIAKDLILIGAGPGHTRVAGVRIGGDAVVELHNFTISNSNPYETGLYAGVKARVTLMNCVLSNSRGSGLEVTGEAQVNIRDCTINGNGDMGLWARGSARIVLEDSAVTENRFHGLLLEGSVLLNLENCVIQGNGWAGICVMHEVQVTVCNSVIRNNQGWGLVAIIGSAPYEEFTGEVVLQNNEIYGNGEGDVCLPDLCLPEDACK